MMVEREDGWIGKGNYGDIYVCWSFAKKEYVVAKIINGKHNCEESEQEAELQRKAQGPNVWPIYNTIKDPDKEMLIHLSPLAGLGNLESVQSRLTNISDNDVIPIKLFICKDVLQGGETIRAKGIYHCDLKRSNVLTRADGYTGVTDFGRGLASSDPRVASRVSDYRTQSPERLCQELFRADLDDAWATGCILLEVMTEKPIDYLFNFDRSRNFIIREKITLVALREAFQKHIDQIPELDIM